jgi:hypothetical protein
MMNKEQMNDLNRKDAAFAEFSKRITRRALRLRGETLKGSHLNYLIHG